MNEQSYVIVFAAAPEVNASHVAENKQNMRHVNTIKLILESPVAKGIN